tara:strand:- start:9044 stop:9292 length:249 start_codon:yes stop_codon:yes gene_type:complete
MLKLNYSSREAYAASVIASADHFTAVVFRGQTPRTKIKRKTYGGILAAAKKLLPTTDRGVLIYAVAGIHDVHVASLQSNRGE